MGSIVSTDKKSRQDEDFPFLKLSNGARLGVKRGWFREAVLPRVTATGKKNILFRLPLGEIRSKFVFLSSNGVGSSHGLKEKQHNK